MKRLLYFAVIVPAVFFGGLLAYSIWTASPRTSQEFFNSGKGYFEAKKYPEATIQLLNAIQKDPRNREARYLLALSYLTQKDLTAAAQQLNSLLEYYPDDEPANLQLGNIYLTAGRTDSALFNQAREIAERILSRKPQNVLALVLLGNALVGLQDYRSSVETFEEALKLDPENATLFVHLGASQALLKNFAEAEKAFLRARQADPKHRGALISLANYYRAVGKNDNAEAVFKEALSIYPSDREIYLQMVEFYLQTGRFGQAETLLRDVQNKNAQDPGPSLLLANLYLATSRPADARKLLLDLKGRFPQDVGVAARLAQILIQDQPDRARTEIDQILKADPRNPIGHILLGELQFFSRQYEEAEATLSKDPAVNSPFPEPHFFLGRLAALKGQTDQAQQHYQKSLEVNAGYLPARMALAELFMNKGRFADARVEVRNLLKQGGFVPARLLKASLDTIERNYADAEKELTALLKEQPNNASVHRQLGIYYESRGLTVDAEKSLLRALELQPDSQEILQGLTQFYISQKQTDRALQRINNVPEEKRQAFHYELMGLAYSQAGKLQESETAYRKALDKEPDRAASNAYLAAQYIQSGRLDDGLQQLDALLKKNPFDASAYATKGLISETQGKLDAAEQNYAQALKIDPNSYAAANNLAYLYAEQGRNLEVALNWAQTARKQEPENPNCADTLGWVQYKLGRHVLARDQLQFAASKQPDNPVFQYHLALVYKETQQIREAETALRKALSSPRNFKERSLADAALKEISRR